ncbi:hypothetical protein ET471_07985 [Xylanimonas protaetiae]|uniref:Phage tail collar domain-containing protein n=2 Tax=Xylanimonas protaetiae TaxID=2509457 RepID=A0A4P6FA25_9MICO|nr:hypothetical protein ET471_07985 [Xylanimonas protaetiae]
MEAEFHTVPTGWLEKNGQAVSRTTYPELFAIYGTTYGAGDGSSTFNLPNAGGRSSVGLDTSQTEFNTVGKTGGAKTHTLNSTEIPGHTHAINHDHGAVTTSTEGSHQHGQVVVAGNPAVINTRWNYVGEGWGATYAQPGVLTDPAGSHSHTVDLPNFTGASGSTGGGAAHNNLPPYMVRRLCVRALPLLP